MNKTLILGFALALVLVSGGFIGAQADCGCFHFHLPSCLSCSHPASDRDLDRPEATCQGAYNYGPKAPTYMGAVGQGW